MSAPALRRLLVALDASSHSRAALATAVRLAARLDAELSGLFVEDEDVLRWARLPIGGVVDPSSAALRAPRPADVEAELRAQAERVRAELESEAARGNVRCRFRVARGSVARELLAAALDADLIVLGRCSWARSRSRGLGATARAVAAGARAAVLLLREGESLAESPVAVFHPGGEAGERALAAGLALAERDGGRLVVLRPPGGEAEGGLPPAPAGLSLHRRSLRRDDPAALAAAVAAEGARLLVLPAGEEPELTRARLEAAPCPVLLLR